MSTFSLGELAVLERTCDRLNQRGPTGTSQRSVCSGFSVLREQEVSEDLTGSFLLNIWGSVRCMLGNMRLFPLLVLPFQHSFRPR